MPPAFASPGLTPHLRQPLPTSLTPVHVTRPHRPRALRTPRASYQYGGAAPGGGPSGSSGDGMNQDRSASGSEPGPGSTSRKFKFDPTSETNAFGRDPKKETEFWMQSARDVLASDEVRDAIDKFMQSGADNLTEEQRAYNDFIKKMDAEAKPDADGDGDGDGDVSSASAAGVDESQ